MSNVFRTVTLPDTGDVITARHWNEQFVDNWNFVGNLGVGDRRLANVGTASPEPFGAMVWLTGKAFYSNFMDYSFPIAYLANARHLRVIATKLKSNHSTTDTVVLYPNNDGTAVNYDTFVRREFGTSQNSYEFFSGAGGFIGLFLGAAPRLSAAAGITVSADMQIWLPNYSGSADYTHYQSTLTGANKTTNQFWTSYAHGRWKQSAAITTLRLATLAGSEFRPESAENPIRVDIYAMLGG